jgi:predicted HicB family RNase H-like nuclease
MFLLSYKGYTGYAQVNDYGQVYGEVSNLKHDVIIFRAECKEQAQNAFIESIEDYLSFCKKIGDTPEVPQSLIDDSY